MKYFWYVLTLQLMNSVDYKQGIISNLFKARI